MPDLSIARADVMVDSSQHTSQGQRKCVVDVIVSNALIYVLQMLLSLLET